jgi:hypothetical protein
LREIPDAGVRERVPPVGERVHHHILCAERSPQLDQGAEVIERRVDTAI